MSVTSTFIFSGFFLLSTAIAKSVLLFTKESVPLSNDFYSFEFGDRKPYKAVFSDYMNRPD